MASFFTELKRRNVFKAGMTYVIVAWIIMQAADVITQNLGLPTWFPQTVTALLILGLPIAIISEHPEAIGRVFNIGSTEETSILRLAERIKELAASSSPITRVPYDEAYSPGFEDMQRRVPDTSRIHSLTGWATHRRLDEILRNVIAAHRTRQPAVVATSQEASRDWNGLSGSVGRRYDAG